MGVFDLLVLFDLGLFRCCCFAVLLVLGCDCLVGCFDFVSFLFDLEVLLVLYCCFGLMFVFGLFFVLFVYYLPVWFALVIVLYVCFVFIS